MQSQSLSLSFTCGPTGRSGLLTNVSETVVNNSISKPKHAFKRTVMKNKQKNVDVYKEK